MPYSSSIPSSAGRPGFQMLAANLLFGLAAASAPAQTTPVPQNLPFTQDFGSAPFSSSPAGVAAWGGLNGNISDAGEAAVSTPSADAAIASAEAPKTTGGCYGHASGGDAAFYIQTSSNSTSGACQLAIAINTTAQSDILLSYDVGMISAQARSIGVLSQYRVGTSGPWTSLTPVSGPNPFSQSGGTTGPQASIQAYLPNDAADHAHVEIRWAIWRGTEAGLSSGVSIDNISVTAMAVSNSLSLTLDPSSISEDAGPAACTVTVTAITPVPSDLPVTLTLTDSSEALVSSANPAVIPAGSSSVTFTLDAVNDTSADGPQSIPVTASATGVVPATEFLTVTDDEDALSPPAGYYDRAAGLSGVTLKQALHVICSENHQQYAYSATYTPLRAIHQDPSNSSNLITVYSGTSLAKNDAYYSGADADTRWSREHVWPVSFGLDPDGVNPGYEDGDAGPDYTDLFNLRPALQTVNIQRGNLYFDDSFGVANVPALAPLCTFDSNSWEPRDEEKGDLARSIFYMATRYDGNEPLTLDLEIGSIPNTGAGRFANLATLLAWHEQDPVSGREREQNQLIFSAYQNNRNPFVDHPEYVTMIWGSVRVSKTACTVAEGGATDNYTLVLTSQPVADVTVSIDISPDSQVLASPASVTFTPGNWNQPQSIQLAAVDDEAYETTSVATLSHSLVSTDPNFATLTPNPVNVTVTDNDPLISALPLPLAYGGPWAPLPTAGFLGQGTGSYSSSLGGDTDPGSLRFDHSGDLVIVSFTGAPASLAYRLKGNPGTGTATEGSFQVFQSSDGENFSLLRNITNKDNSDEAFLDTLAPETRFVSFVFATKVTGNIQLDQLAIAATTSPWLAWQSLYGVSGATGDEDFDGLSNLAEYALGQSPVLSEPNPVATTFDSEGDLIRIVVVLRTDDPRLMPIAETTTDPSEPASWSSTGASYSPAVDQSEVATGFERAVFEIPAAGEPKRFVRLRFVVE